jgi:hypothetical protein
MGKGKFDPTTTGNNSSAYLPPLDSKNNQQHQSVQ